MNENPTPEAPEDLAAQIVQALQRDLSMHELLAPKATEIVRACLAGSTQQEITLLPGSNCAIGQHDECNGFVNRDGRSNRCYCSCHRPVASAPPLHPRGSGEFCDDLHAYPIGSERCYCGGGPIKPVTPSPSQRSEK